MKKLNVLWIACFMLLSANVWAQKPFAGTIRMETRVEGTDDANITANYPMEQTLTVLGNLTLLKQDPLWLIMNGDKNQMTLLLDFSTYGFGMYYETITKTPSKTKKYEYAVDKSDTKTILGYSCYKVTALVIDSEEEDTTTVIYYMSDDFLPTFKDVNQPGLPGFPLLTIVEVDNIEYSFTTIVEVKEITPSKKVKETLFMLPSEAKSFDEAPEELQEVVGTIRENISKNLE